MLFVCMYSSLAPTRTFHSIISASREKCVQQNANRFEWISHYPYELKLVSKLTRLFKRETISVTSSIIIRWPKSSHSRKMTSGHCFALGTQGRDGPLTPSWKVTLFEEGGRGGRGRAEIASSVSLLDRWTPAQMLHLQFACGKHYRIQVRNKQNLTYVSCHRKRSLVRSFSHSQGIQKH